MQQQTALLLGASGLIGSFCLEYLLSDNNYSKITAAVRHKLDVEDPKLEQIIIPDFSKLNEFESIFGATHIYCCVGTTIKKAGTQEAFKKVDLDIPIKAAELAAKHGAKAFLVVSSIGASAKTGNFYLRTKGEMEQSVISSGISAVHIFRPSLLLGPRKEFRFGEKIGEFFAKLLAPLMLGSLKKYKPIYAETVARAMLKTASEDKKGVFIYESDEIERIGK